MTTLQRISPLEFDVGHDEELPSYEASTAPAYDSGGYDDPMMIYHLQQYDRKIQIMVSHGLSSSTSYRITTNSFRLFGKKRPSMEVLYTSHEMRQRVIANISFDNDGPLPWRPRAYFDHNSPDGLDTRYNMESANFADWTFSIGDRMFAWALDMVPVSLVLSEQHSSLVIARFTYSAEGTLAVRGAEVGDLAIYRDSLTVELGGVDKVVCALMVAVSHLKKMGRHYRNESARSERTDSLTRDISTLHRASLAGAPTF